ncbi:VOC family protein [Streptomyces sp. NPDC006645]|uniref:VOC family protein n=1 Tax=unclassified Streptomyces TaxID=2593676 RepID=UPI0033A4EE2A
MALEWDSLVIDAADPVALGHWWCQALGWTVVTETADECEVRPAPDRMPGLFFGFVPEAKTVKNRLHLDFRPDDRDAEVERLLALGARRADVGQRGDEPWVVLADPEGNEFCVLGERTAGQGLSGA